MALKKHFFLWLGIFLAYNSDAQPSEFNQPWIDSTKAIILDPYQGNDMDWDKIATEKRVVAIIHKATQGSRIDKKCLLRREIAKKRGYKWGTYHLGVPGNPIAQADFYLKTVGINSDEVYALDLEGIDPQKFMPLDSAVKFIARVYQKTGRYPLVYCNKVVLNAISSQYDSSSIFSRCPLWYARFRQDIPAFRNNTWKTYTLWQFSSEINCAAENKGYCPFRVPGTNNYMDINIYNGSVQTLISKWPNI